MSASRSPNKLAGGRPSEFYTQSSCLGRIQSKICSRSRLKVIWSLANRPLSWSPHEQCPANTPSLLFSPATQNRHVFQLHHVHGGLVCGDHDHDSQLPPSARRHSWYASVGESQSRCLIQTDMVTSIIVTPTLPLSSSSQVRTVFLQWIPWVLRMGRPGEKITRKTIMIQNKMKELDLQAKSSKSLLANVLDMDDDFR